MSAFRGYLLITNGPRHLHPIEDHPTAQQQLYVLNKRAEAYNAKLVIVAHDYARKIRSFDDLPNLFAVLNEAKQVSNDQANRHHIFIDDYTRLFRAAVPEFRPALWNALLEHAAFITDLRQRKSLDEASQEKAVLIRTGLLPSLKERAPRKARLKHGKEAQTAKARRVSAVSRSQSAARSAEALRLAYDRCRTDNPGRSFKDFIEGDVAMGLRNSHGGPWTYRSGLRAIRSLSGNAG